MRLTDIATHAAPAGRAMLAAGLLALAAACADHKGDPADPLLAVYDGDELRLSQVRLAASFTAEDSVEALERNIEAWLVERAMFDKAAQHIGDAEARELEEQAAEYRRRLYTTRYRQALARQRVDTVVGGDEVRAYYEKFGDELLLNHPIVRAWRVTLPAGLPDVAKVASLMAANDDKSAGELRRYCAESLESYRLDSAWMPLSRLGAEVGAASKAIADKPERRVYRFDTPEAVTLVKVIDFARQGEKPPVEYVEHRIRRIVVRNRVEQFFYKYEGDLLHEARKNQNRTPRL